MKKFKVTILFIVFISFFTSTIPNIVFGQNKANPLLIKTSKTLNLFAPIQQVVSFSIPFSRKNLSMNYTMDGLSIKMKDCISSVESNQPKLPMFVKKIVIRKDLAIAYYKTTRVESIDYPLPSTTIETVKPPKPYINFDKPVKNYEQILNTSNIVFYPSENFTLSTQIQGENRIINLYIYPVYLVQRRLFLATKIDIVIGLTKTEDPPIENKNKWDSLILTPDDFIDSANQLKKIQEKQGYKVSIAKLSDLRNHTPVDRPKSKAYVGVSTIPPEKRKILSKYDDLLACKIISYLQTLVKKDSIDYLTILGDASLIPPSYYIQSGYNMESFDSWTPTDQFYMAPLTTGDEFNLLISCGRLPVRDKSEAVKMVQKISNYIDSLNPEWFQNAVIMGGDPFQGDFMGELITLNSVNKDYFNGMKLEKYFRTSGKFGRNDVLNLFSTAEKGLIFEIGHGSGSGLALEPGMIYAQDMIKLPVKSKLPVLVSIACLNGAYDTRMFEGNFFQTSKELKYPTSFSEASILSDGGAIAYIGGARNNYGAVDDVSYEEGICKTSDESNYMAYVLENFCGAYHSGAVSLGEMSIASLNQYLTKPWGFHGTPGINTFFGFTLLGDPTIKLPKMKETLKYSKPTISHGQKFRNGPLDLPFIPIDNGLDLQMNTDSKSLKYYISDYDSEKKALLQEGIITQKSSVGFTHHFENYIKSRLTIRVESDDYKESRLVFHGRYNHDLVITERSDLFLLKPGEKKRYMAEIRNDGINEEKDISVSIIQGDKTKTYEYPFFPILTSYYVWYDFLEEKAGTYTVQIKAPNLPEEKVTGDNEINRILQIKDQSLIRIGYLSESVLMKSANPDIMDQIKDLNAYFQKRNRNIEIFPIYFNLNPADMTTQLDRLKPDLILWDSPNGFDYSLNSYANVFEQFIQKGGKILGFSPFGKNLIEFEAKEIQSMFGIKKEANIALKDWSASQKTIQIANTIQSAFSKSEFAFPCDQVMVGDSEISNDILAEGADILASSSDQSLKLIRHGNCFLFTGMLNWEKLLKNEESLQFLNDLFVLASSIEVKPYLDFITIDPPIGTKNQESTLTIQISNPSTRAFNDLHIKIEAGNNQAEEIPIDLLSSNQTLRFQKALSWRGIVGEQKILVDFMEDKRVIGYDVLQKNEPDKPPLLDIGNIPEYTLIDTVKIEGTSNPNAIVSINDQVIAVNKDGTFVSLLPLVLGDNQFILKAKEGSLVADKQFHIVRKQKIELSLKIGELFSYQSGAIIPLQEPPQIIKGSTMVPLRFITDSFQCQKTDWDAKDQKITILAGSIEIILWINKRKALVNDKEIELSMAPLIGKSGRTLVPLRFIAEAFGAELSWNKDLQEIKIVYGRIVSESKKLSILSKDPLPEEPEQKVILNKRIEEEIANPACYDFDGTNFYVLTRKGIVLLDRKLTYSKTLPIPKEYFEISDFVNLNVLLSEPRRSLLKVTDKYIILTDYLNHILVFDKNDFTFLRCFQSKEYGSSVYPWNYFSRIQDIDATGTKLYVLNLPKGLVQIDIPTGEIQANYNTLPYSDDIEIKNNKIFIMAMDQFQIMDLNGQVLKNIKSDDYFFLYAMTINQNEEIVAKDLFSDYLMVINQSGKIVKKIITSEKLGLIFEKMSYIEADLYTLSVFTSKTEPRIYSELLHLDPKLKILDSAGVKGYEEMKKNKELYLNCDSLWIMKDQSKLLAFEGSYSDTIVKKISKDRKIKKTIDITPQYENIDSLYSYQIGKSLNESDKFGCLWDSMYLIDYLVFQAVDLKTEDITYTQLKPKSVYYQFRSFDFSNDKLYAYDIFSGSILVFDLSTGEEINKISLVLPSGSLFAVDNLLLRKNLLYCMDRKSEKIYILTTEGILQDEISWESLVMPNQQMISQMDVTKNGEIFLLDSSRSKVFGFEKGTLAFESGENIFYYPTHFSVMEDQFLVNDWGHQQIISMAKTWQEIKSKDPVLSVFPNEITKIVVANPIVQIPLFISQCFTNQPIEFTVPDWIQIDGYNQEKNSQVFDIKINTSALMLDRPLSDKIVIKCGQIIKEIPVTIQQIRDSVSATNQSSYYLLKDRYYLSAEPAKIEKGFVSFEEDSLRNLFGYKIDHVKDEIILSRNNLIFALKTGSSKGFIMTKSGKVEIDLIQKVESIHGHIRIPINTIFNLDSIPFTTAGDSFSCDL